MTRRGTSPRPDGFVAPPAGGTPWTYTSREEGRRLDAEILATFSTRCRAEGRGLTVPEWRGHWAARTGASVPRQIESRVRKLIAQGVLIVTGMDGALRQYAPAGVRPPMENAPPRRANAAHTRRLGARALALLQLIAEECARRGTAVTLAEVKAAWEAGTGQAATRVVNEGVRRLAVRGDLVVAGGVRGAKQYRPRDLPVPPSAGSPSARRVHPDVLRAVYEAVCRAHRALCAVSADGCAEVSTTRVRAELAQTGLRLRSGEVLETLHRLTRGVPYAPPEWTVPRVAATCVHIGPGGWPSYWWRPVEAPLPATLEGLYARNAQESAVLATLAAQQALGRPVTAREVRIWVYAHRRRHRVAMEVDLAAVVLELRRYRRAEGRPATQRQRALNVEVVHGQLATPAGTPTRFAVLATRPKSPEGAPETLAPLGVQVCHLHDVLYGYRPGVEWVGIRALERDARVLQVPVLAELASVRRAALLGALERQLREVIPFDALPSVIAHARAGLTRVEEWVRDPSSTMRLPMRHLRLRQLVRDAAALRAMERLAPWITARLTEAAQAPQASRVHVVGEAAVLRQPDVLEIEARLRATYGEAWQPQGKARQARRFESARRFPDPDGMRAQSFVGYPHRPRSRIDRVDLMIIAHQTVGLPTASALLRSGMATLGHVVRDATPFRAALEALPPGEAPARRALLVALALLGEAPPPEVALAGAVTREDMSAYVFALALADPNGCAPRIEAAYRAARSPAAREVADVALMRLAVGGVFGVVG